MFPKYKVGDVLLYTRLNEWPDVYFYVKKILEEEYLLGRNNKYGDEQRYFFNAIDQNDKISLSLSSMLKKL